MSLDKTTVGKIARLSRLRLEQKEQETLANELSKIFVWIEQLNQVNTEEAMPMSSVVDVPLRKRPDVVDDGECSEEVLSNAPEKTADFYVVPKVIE